MRLLTGPLCRLGAADLDGLAAWARFLQRRDGAGPATDSAARPDPTRLRLPGRAGRPAGDESAAAGAACPTSRTRRWTAPTGPASSRRWTSCRRRGGARPRASTCQPWPGSACSGCARRCDGCARSTGMPLADLVGEAERALGLDIEVLARPGAHRRPRPGRTSTRSPTSRPTSPAAPTGPRWAGSWPGSTPRSPRSAGSTRAPSRCRRDAVQVLTVHAAKGLEWDVVAVPGLVEGVVPRPVQRGHVVQGRAVADEPADRQGLVRRTVRGALRPARRPRRVAGAGLAARARPQGAGGRDVAGSSATAASTASRRSAGWPTWPSPGPAPRCC